MVTEITVMRCRCDRCGNSWTSEREEPPRRCPGCQSREWNGKKQLVRSHVNEISFPAPRTQGRPKVYAGGVGICLDDLD